MGADSFVVKSKGKTAQKAFDAAVKEAQYDYGHRGYTGTIAEKSKFIMIDLPSGLDPEQYVDKLIDECDERIDDKWGPAGCIKLAEKDMFLFFGWASS